MVMGGLSPPGLVVWLSEELLFVVEWSDQLSLAGNLVSRRRGSVYCSWLVTVHSRRSVHGVWSDCVDVVSVFCVCKQVKSFWDLSSMAAPPLFWFCPTFVMSSSLQGRVALTVSDRAFSYRIVCLFCVSPAWTQRRCAVRPNHVLCSGARIRFKAPILLTGVCIDVETCLS